MSEKKVRNATEVHFPFISNVNFDFLTRYHYFAMFILLKNSEY
jgi:hypothetical protein